ncbi:hypothetical protein RJ639_041375 [Escallonia herrerae]|uniref:Protein kinase and PP2C-like domain-containing protein n=1 Tax=Escallonia herrerae TaxID=1293975 RepID=A0AA89BB60_9ASTE|nr:hypothetical protein RJ639_041375 [Escallonia herrerae]
MAVEMVEPNTCIRGCCRSESIPLHLPPSSYSLSSPIARGAESVVYEATLDGKKVAVKKPFLSTSDDLDKFHKELQLLCKVEHPGIAVLVAAHAKPPNYMFFFELYEAGSLAQKLHAEEWTPGVDQALAISLQLAKALQYLHNLGIVHRDVKPANILLDKDNHPHLADFGLAAYKRDLKQISGTPTGGFHKKNMVGTLIYMAPEILRKDIHTEKSDVYSFGISINELLTGVVPSTDIRAEAQAHTVLEINYTEQRLTAAVVSEGLRPLLAGLESGTPARSLSLIQRCWDMNPNNRPSFQDIVVELDLIVENNGTTKLEKKASAEHSTSPSGQNKMNFRAYQESINWFTLGEDFPKKNPPTSDSGMRTWISSPTDSLQYQPVLSWGSFASCGRRETMEDTHFLMPQMWDEEDIHMFGIFDGHRAAAEFSARALPGFLQMLGSISSPNGTLLEAFIKTDVAFRSVLGSFRKSRGAIKKDWHPGFRNKLYVANAGDCRTILCRAGCAHALSKDHVASCLEERERVISSGGEVKWQIDTWRLVLLLSRFYLPLGDAGLMHPNQLSGVTRSIGDDDLKPAVTAEPEITEVMLSVEDEYLVMASDGLWDVMSNVEVVSIIKDTVKEAGMCSKRLATEAAERGSKDNITVIVVFLRPVSTAERIY